MNAKKYSLSNTVIFKLDVTMTHGYFKNLTVLIPGKDTLKFGWVPKVHPLYSIKF